MGSVLTWTNGEPMEQKTSYNKKSSSHHDREWPSYGGFVIWTEAYFLCEITTNVRLFTSDLPYETSATQFSGPRPANRSGESRTAVTFSIFKRGIDPAPERATWWHDVKLVRLLQTDLSIQLGTGRPLVARSVIDTNILLQPSYSPGNEPDWNDTWWRNMSLTKAPMGPALLEIVKLESKD